jgi:hypothetical protein
MPDAHGRARSAAIAIDALFPGLNAGFSGVSNTSSCRHVRREPAQQIQKCSDQIRHPD